MVKSENLITRINYDWRIKYGLAAIVFGASGLAVRSVDSQGSGAHIFLVSCAASLRQVLVNDNNIWRDAAVGVAGGVSLEAVQLFYPKLGEPEGKDIVMNILGCFVWYSFEKSARWLHDSGSTDSLYQLLGISKRG